MEYGRLRRAYLAVPCPAPQDTDEVRVETVYAMLCCANMVGS